MDQGDGAVNITDIVKQIKYLLGVLPPPEGFAFFVADVNGDGNFNILDLVAMVNLILYGDLLLPVGRAEGMMLESRIADGALRVVVYSLDGRGIAPGSGAVIHIPVRVAGSADTPVVSVSEVVAASPLAQAMPVLVETEALAVRAAPTAFSLKPNRPNPFNPATVIDRL